MSKKQPQDSNQTHLDDENTSQVLTLKQEATNFLNGVRHGRMGSFPAVIGFLVLVVLFSFLSPVFFTQLNFANLLQQSAPLIILAMGLVFILLIAEIDLSAGVTSGPFTLSWNDNWSCHRHHGGKSWYSIFRRNSCSIPCLPRAPTHGDWPGWSL